MKKSDFTRSTRECTMSEFKPSFLQCMAKYIEENNIENIENEVEACFETTNLKKGFLGRIKTSHTEICITQRFLFWDIVENKSNSNIAGAQWTELSEIKDWENTEMGKMIEDCGLEIFGFIYRWSRRSTWFIGIDRSEAGMRCRALIKDKIVKNSV